MASIVRPATLRHACMYGQVRTAFKTQAANPISISQYTTLSPQKGSITSRIASIRSAAARNTAPLAIHAAQFQTSSRRDILPTQAREVTSLIEPLIQLILDNRNHSRHRLAEKAPSLNLELIAYSQRSRTCTPTIPYPWQLSLDLRKVCIRDLDAGMMAAKESLQASSHRPYSPDRCTLRSRLPESHSRRYPCRCDPHPLPCRIPVRGIFPGRQ